MPLVHTLRSKISLMLAGLVLITGCGAFVLVWYTYSTEELLDTLIRREISAFQTAEELEKALVSQKGFVSYYFLDGDPEWLRQLGEYRQIFKDRLETAKASAVTDEEKEMLATIEREYRSYVELKDQVLALQREGRRDSATELNRAVRTRFQDVLKRCRDFKDLHREMIRQAWDHSVFVAKTMRAMAFLAVVIVSFLAFLLIFMILKQILTPLKRLAETADPGGAGKDSGNEVKALSRSVHGLLKNMDRTHLELERSRETLLQAEKMALIGKLAAGTAHSIRNPLTSVKMRLFSLSRTLNLNTDQKEDFQVISEEIRHIDNIVQNFLEFSRPPKLKMQEISPSEVVDLTLQLMRHRLTTYEVDVVLKRDSPLPKVTADPEQLKEVLVNILVNACEAMERGGSIVIREEALEDPLRGKMAAITIADNGPGIPEALLDKVLQPFFTTKEQGTGLGLSIAARIIEQHRGWLDLESSPGKGTTFIISLPVKDQVA